MSLERAKTGSFSYRSALEELCFLNVPLLSLSELIKATHRRGLLFSTLIKPHIWETLDRLALLSPVGFWPSPNIHGGESQALKEGALALREEAEFRPWGELGNPVYSVWSLLSLGQIYELLLTDFPLDGLEHGVEELVKRTNGLSEGLQSGRRFQGHEDAWRRNDLLLIKTQSLILPMITNIYRSPSFVPELGNQDPFDWTIEQQANFDYVAAAEQCGVDAAALAKLYEELAWAGNQLDPMADWFDLVDQISSRQQEKLKGAALRAIDFYRGARVIRGWHARLGEEVLPDINEIRHGVEDTRETQERLYGTSDIRNNRAALPGILEHFELYPWRVQLIIEGSSEERMLDAILKDGYGRSMDKSGIHVVDLGGAGIPKKADRLLSAVRTYANYYFLVFDNEGNTGKLIEELGRRGQIEIEPETKVWQASLEADNFSIDEICTVVESMAREVEVCLSIGRDDVSAQYADGKSGLVEVIGDIAGDSNYTVSKPALAERLGKLAVEVPEHEGKRREILDLAEHLLRLAGASRILRGRLRG